MFWKVLERYRIGIWIRNERYKDCYRLMDKAITIASLPSLKTKIISKVKTAKENKGDHIFKEDPKNERQLQK